MVQTNNKSSVGPFINPQNIAIIGASPNFQKPNGIPIQRLLECGFPGKIYPVNPKHKKIAGLTCYPNLFQIPDKISLAIVAVPAAGALQVLRQCAQKGVEGAVVFTAGFAETGGEGVDLQEEIRRLSLETGLRIVGPNCLGVINLSKRLWAAFAPPLVPKKYFFKKRFDFISQSGFFGVLMYQIAAQEGLLFDKFFSVGNEADLSLPHFLQVLAEEKNPETKIISCYIEGIKEKDGPLFKSAVEKAIHNQKIITAIKIGQTEAGAKAASSHTAALTGTDQVYDSFFRQKGVIRAPGPEQLLSLLKILASERLPENKKTAIISDSGGAAVLLAEKCQLYGLEMATFEHETRQKMQEILPSFASNQNPVDITAQILTEADLAYQCISLVAKDPNVDILILNFFIEPKNGPLIISGIKKLYEQNKKPIIVNLWAFSDEGLQYIEKLKGCGLPVFQEMDDCIWALGTLAKRMAKIKHYENPLLENPGLEQKKAKTFFEDYAKNAYIKPGTANPSGDALLPMSEYRMKQILSCYNIPISPEAMVYSEEEALKSAVKLGYPVTLKVVSPAIAHKTEVGGVKLNINCAEETKKAFHDLKKHVSLDGHKSPAEGILVQKMFPSAVEIIIGVKRDPVFGPVIICGLGGIFVEVLSDVSMRIAPLSRQDATEMLQELQGSKILSGVRGKEAADQEAVIDVLLKVSRLALEMNGLVELDINPLLVYPSGQGVVAVDAWGYWNTK